MSKSVRALLTAGAFTAAYVISSMHFAPPAGDSVACGEEPGKKKDDKKGDDKRS